MPCMVMQCVIYLAMTNATTHAGKVFNGPILFLGAGLACWPLPSPVTLVWLPSVSPLPCSYIGACVHKGQLHPLTEVRTCVCMMWCVW